MAESERSSPGMRAAPPAGFQPFTDDLGFTYFVFRPELVQFHAGDVVYVSLRSHRDTGRATILEYISDPTSEYAGRYKVQYHHDSSIAHARVERLTPVLMWPAPYRAVIVCSSTDDFRRLARSQLTRADHCLDVGCSYGRGTAVMAQHCASVVGVDLSAETILSARRTYEHIRFERLDVMKHVDELLALGRDCSHAFVDIGGNREVETLTTLLPHLERTLPAVRLLVVKSSKLHRSALQHSASVPLEPPPAVPPVPSIMQPVPRCGAWWCALRSRLPTRSAELLGVIAAGAATACEAATEPAPAPVAAAAAAATPSPPVPIADDAAAAVDAAPAAVAAAARRRLHPLDHPARLAPDGRVICRFFNYAERGCRDGAACAFDHSCCNRCGGAGHVARLCTVPLSDLRL